MPQDLLQISLEHHRAGRLTQAEAGYRSVLVSNPDDPEALHWLGVLLYQAGNYQQAVPLLESATARCPADAAYQHNLAHAYLSAGDKDRAIAAFERAAAANPTGGESLVAVAQARLARGAPGDAEAALAALDRAKGQNINSVDISHLLGMALLAAGRPTQAMDTFRAVLRQTPADAMVHFHLALACRRAGEIKETRKALIKALEYEPTLAPAWCALAMLDVESGNLEGAAGLFRRAISADRKYADAHEGLGRVLQQLGQSTDAAAAFEQTQRLRASKSTPDDPAGLPGGAVAELQRHLTPTQQQADAHFAMAALMNVFPPGQLPQSAVAGLFDRYAERFDRHLVDTLGYRLPEELVESLRPLCVGRLLDVLDAGCGTGLCGPLLRPLSRRLVGVDLSAAMIEKARLRKVYDDLQVGDLLDFLRKSPDAFDMVVCADVLIYLGEAAPFFEAAAAAIRPGGVLAFTVEAGNCDRFELNVRSRRFTHSKNYLQHLARIYGFTEQVFQTTVARKEADVPVPAYIVVLSLP